MALPAALEDVKISTLPSSAYYIADFISEAEEKVLLDKIHSAPKPRWKYLSHRRLQTWPSDLNKDVLLAAPLPTWLIEPAISRILSIPISSNDPTHHIFTTSPHHSPNHILINEYEPGQGIMPHQDGAAYHPVVCTISLGSSLCLDIYAKNDEGAREAEPRWRILQEPRSLLITTGEMYTNHMHGIADVKEDVNLDETTVANWELLRDKDGFVGGKNERTVRTSLTIRDVLKVSNVGSKLGLFGRKW